MVAVATEECYFSTNVEKRQKYHDFNPPNDERKMKEHFKLELHVLRAVGFKLTDLKSNNFGMLLKEEEVVLSSQVCSKLHISLLNT